MIKKRDIILALMLILLGIVCYGVIRLGQKKGSQVIIYEDQKEIGRYPVLSHRHSLLIEYFHTCSTSAP